MSTVCDSRGITSHFYKYFHHNKLHGESGLQVHDSHRLKAENYLHATYSSGSVCVSGLSFMNFIFTQTDVSHNTRTHSSTSSTIS